MNYWPLLILVVPFVCCPLALWAVLTLEADELERIKAEQMKPLSDI